MRLLHVIRSVNPVHGGPAEGVRQLISATLAMGQQPEVLTLDAPEDAWVQSFPGAIHAVGPVAFNYGYTKRLVPWLRKYSHHYEAVVVHGLWQYHGLAVRRALRGGPVPYFVYPHGMLDPWFRREYPLKHAKKALYWAAVEGRVVRDAAAVLFTASEEAALASQSFHPYLATPAVIGYGIALGDPERLGTADSFFESWPETRGKRIVLFLGRLHPKKGGDLLIEAFARLAPSHPDLHLVMAGPDDGEGTQARLEALSVRLGVADRITWTGMLKGDAKWSAVKAAEVFALPSHQENFGIAVVEAMALGRPVLISDKVNIWREIVQTGAGLAGADTVDGTLASLHRWLAFTPDQRAAMRVQAVACYQQHFHMTSAAKRLIATIQPHAPQAPEPMGTPTSPAPLGLDSQR